MLAGLWRAAVVRRERRYVLCRFLAFAFSIAAIIPVLLAFIMSNSSRSSGRAWLIHLRAMRVEGLNTNTKERKTSETEARVLKTRAGRFESHARIQRRLTQRAAHADLEQSKSLRRFWSGGEATRTIFPCFLRAFVDPADAAGRGWAIRSFRFGSHKRNEYARATSEVNAVCT